MAKNMSSMDTKVSVPESKPTIGKDIPADSGKGIGKPGSPVKTVPDSGIIAKDTPFGSGNGTKPGFV
jgi:hypothetical protein